MISRDLSPSLFLSLEAKRWLRDVGKIRNSDCRLPISGAASSLGTKFIGLISDHTNESRSAKFRRSLYIRERAQTDAINFVLRFLSLQSRCCRYTWGEVNVCTLNFDEIAAPLALLY